MRKRILLLLPALAVFWLVSRQFAQEEAKPSLDQEVGDLPREMVDGRVAFDAHPLFVQQEGKP